MILKFRAWDHDLKYMFTIGDMPNLLIGFDGHVYNNGFPFTSQIKCISSSITIMQFTGLTDKNANDIYVDDIVQDKEKSYMRVIWDDRRLCYTIEGENLGDYDSCDLEIIGNIHQHSHLLDKGE